MNPGDVIARATGVYAVVAMVGSTAAVVPLVRGYVAKERGNIEVCPINAGVSARRMFAKCSAATRMALNGSEERIGRLSVVELANMTVAIRRVAESMALERKYGGPYKKLAA